MNRLQLCQRVAQECGVSGSLVTTVNQIGEQQLVVGWVDQAWDEIQTAHDDWEFMRSSNLIGAGVSFATVAGQASYPLGTGAGTVGVASTAFGKWDRYSFRVYATAAGSNSETFLDWVPYDYWRDGYMFGAQRTVQTRPVSVAIGPNKSVCLGPPPNDQYTVTGDYFIAPTVMTANGNTPTGLPTQFHMLIVYKAMQFYAGYEAAPEVMQRGIGGYDSMMSQLEANYAPEIMTAGALA